MRDGVRLPSAVGFARTREAVRGHERQGREGANLLPGGRLPAGLPAGERWPVRVLGPASSSLPGLWSGALLRLAYDPLRPVEDGGPVVWYAPDRPPKPAWKRTPDGDPDGRVADPPQRDYAFYSATHPHRPAEDLAPCLLVPGTGGSLAAGQEGVGVLVGDWEGVPILLVVSGGGGGKLVPVRITGGSGPCGPYTGRRVRKTGSACGWEDDPAYPATLSLVRLVSGPADPPDVGGGQVVWAQDRGEGWEFEHGSQYYALPGHTGDDPFTPDEVGPGHCFVDDVDIACTDAGLVLTVYKKRNDFRGTKARDLEFSVEVRDCEASS